ncbi:hypothetical protein [Rhizobium leguminosarum]|uniref:hypothetical protein n=1 Tax=Rhizobium leguminosarum TaxID=384 RepID=UPI003F951E36
MAQVDIVSLRDNADPARRLRLPTRDDSGKHVDDLQCIDRSMLADPGLIDDLTTWRNQSMPFFLTQFSGTEDRTRRWLETISLPAADRIQFVICDPGGNRFGNFGVCNIRPGSAEFDNVIRGRASGIGNLMFHCGMTMLEWMFSGLGINRPRCTSSLTMKRRSAIQAAGLCGGRKPAAAARRGRGHGRTFGRRSTGGKCRLRLSEDGASGRTFPAG